MNRSSVARWALTVWLGGTVFDAFAASQSEIPPLLPAHGALQPSFWELHGWQCVLGAVVFLGVVIAVIMLLRRPRAMIVQPPGVIARQALEQLRGRTEDGALVMNVSRILKRYMIAALKLPAGELTTTEFCQALCGQPQLDPELASTTGNFLRRCDEWKFAPERPVQKLGAVEGALELVKKLESSQRPAENKELIS